LAYELKDTNSRVPHTPARQIVYATRPCRSSSPEGWAGGVVGDMAMLRQLGRDLPRQEQSKGVFVLFPHGEPGIGVRFQFEFTLNPSTRLPLQEAGPAPPAGPLRATVVSVR